ncbi:MAG: hypothetical protein LIR50_05605 [Bacillota bacterium]|nr:hypothetical protein [Bacillota bacterium]
MIKFETNRDNAKWIGITKTLLFWIEPKQQRVQFMFWKAPGLKKFYGFKNCKFKIFKGSNEPISINNLRILIRLPFFYWYKHNCGWEFGLSNYYLWWHKARKY